MQSFDWSCASNTAGPQNERKQYVRTLSARARLLEIVWALQMREELDKDLYDLLCDKADRHRLVQCLVKHGVTTQSDQEGALAEATMSYDKICTLESELNELKLEHKQLQQDHKQLQEDHKKLQEDHKQLQEDHKQLQQDHKQLQQEYKQLQQEVAMDQAQRNEIRIALQNLACAPFDSMRRGFEMHRILYGSKNCA